ncbi:uncharacterized protein TRIADDRAFT_62200 [Trichoplax adhaerens]|uniref:Uncharacterized protein n=1 Tax=Trichoplax adhaerens TaxID=10228 RepID=B3SD44_TRIAD|nr:predicted protein [Trichoplax adhaerens]EDV19379.1 predicted protein [Trichoplax adhaerens]|eukprot:XP_002118154.1 predicted protein [Trichoplax adhaerens]
MTRCNHSTATHLIVILFYNFIMLKIKLFKVLYWLTTYSLISCLEIEVIEYDTLNCQEVRTFVSQSWNLCKLTGFTKYQLKYNYICKAENPLHIKPEDEKRSVAGMPEELTVSRKESNQFLQHTESKRQLSSEFYPVYTSCCDSGRNETHTECNVIDIMVGCNDEVNFEFTSTGACEMTKEMNSLK